jgi:hypothetical protein
MPIGRVTTHYLDVTMPALHTHAGQALADPVTDIEVEIVPGESNRLEMTLGDVGVRVEGDQIDETA